MTCPPFRCCITGENGFTYPLATGLEKKNFRELFKKIQIFIFRHDLQNMLQEHKPTGWWLLWLSELSHCSASTQTGEKLRFILALVCSGVVISLWGYSWHILFLSSHVPFFHTHFYCAFLMTEEKPFLQSLETLVYWTQFNLIFFMEEPNSVYLCLFMRDPRVWAWTSD